MLCYFLDDIRLDFLCYLDCLFFWLFWFTICLDFRLVGFLEYMSLDVWVIRFLYGLDYEFLSFLKKIENCLDKC